MVLAMKVIGVLVFVDLVMVVLIMRKRNAERFWKSQQKQQPQYNPWVGTPIDPSKLKELNAERWQD